MNKFLIIAAVAVILFAGCSKKNNAAPSSLIVGKWHFVSDTINIYNNGTLSSSTPQPLKSTGYVQFNADGTGTESPTTDTVKFNYTIANSMLTLNYPTQIVDGVQVNAGTNQFAIKILDSHNLYLFSDATKSNGGNSERVTQASHLTR